MLGKVIETYFEKNCNTSWVIDALEQKNENGYYYDTLKLFRIFHLLLIGSAGEYDCFSVSFYIKRDEDCSGNALDSKLTLSKIKQAYAEEHITQETAEFDNFLSKLLNEIDSLDWELEIQDIMFKTTITFKAQAANWSNRGKTKTYHIVGVNLERVL